MGSNPVAVTWQLVVLFSTVLISILRTVNCHSTGFLQGKHQLGLDVEENGWKLSTEVTGIDGLQKEYQKSVNMVVTSSQMDKNSFKSVLIKKINGVYDKLSVLFFHLKRKFKLFGGKVILKSWKNPQECNLMKIWISMN